MSVWSRLRIVRQEALPRGGDHLAQDHLAVSHTAALPPDLEEETYVALSEVGEALHKLWLFRCPHHGIIDGKHYREQEWSEEEGCPLLAADEECCGQVVERIVDLFGPAPSEPEEER